MRVRISQLLGSLALLAMTCSCSGSTAGISASAQSLPGQAISAPAPAQTDAHHPRSILFVGNSYFYYNDSLHNHVKRMVVAAGILENSQLTYKSSTIGGAALFDHPIEHLLVPQNLRVPGRFELVVMAGQSNAALTPERRAKFAETAKEYAAIVREAGGEPVLYMTHAYVSPHRLARPDMIDDVASLYVDTGRDIDAQVIPVGLAFAEAYRRRPEILLHKDFDGSHPSLLGTYLAAATVVASLYDISPVGNTYDYFGAIDPADALFLQQVAQDTVTQFNGRQ